MTLTREDGEKLTRLVKATKSDASKVMRLALRSFYKRELDSSMEKAYRKYYQTPDAEADEIAADFTSAGVPLW